MYSICTYWKEVQEHAFLNLSRASHRLCVYYSLSNIIYTRTHIGQTLVRKRGRVMKSVKVKRSLQHLSSRIHLCKWEIHWTKIGIFRQNICLQFLTILDHFWDFEIRRKTAYLGIEEAFLAWLAWRALYSKTAWFRHRRIYEQAPLFLFPLKIQISFVCYRKRS